MNSAKTRRAQILMSPQEYEQLERIARLQEVSVAELIRRAVYQCYFQSPQRRIDLLEGIFSLGLPAENWEDLDAEVAAAHGDDIH